MDSVELNVWNKNNYSITEAFRTLRTNIQFCGDDIKTILFTSFGENEGKSTIVMNLARAVADNCKRVLVIDTDIRKSVLIRELRPRTVSGKNICGLSHYLSGQKKIDDVIYKVEQKQNLHLIFGGPFVTNSVELLGNHYMDSLIEYAKDNYDIVLLDSATLGYVIDPAVIANRCDAAIIVISQGACNRRQILGVKKQLSASGVKILGTVLNKVNLEKKGYYGKYYGKYYGRYGQYGEYETTEKKNCK